MEYLLAVWNGIPHCLLAIVNLVCTRGTQRRSKGQQHDIPWLKTEHGLCTYFFFSSSTYLINSKSRYDIFTFRPPLFPFLGLLWKISSPVEKVKDASSVELAMSTSRLARGFSHKSPSHIILSFFVGGAIKSLHTNASFSIQPGWRSDGRGVRPPYSLGGSPSARGMDVTYQSGPSGRIRQLASGGICFPDSPLKVDLLV